MSTVRLFTNHTPVRLGPAPQGASLFSYLDESARPAAAAVRERFEDWFSGYPSESRSDVRSRFRSPEDPSHLGAAFEILVFALLRAMNCGVETILGDSQRPDFLVHHPTEGAFRLEATVAMSRSAERISADRRHGAALDALNSLQSPNFRLHVVITSVGSREVPKKELVAFTRDWLEGLPYEKTRIAYDSLGARAMPRTTFQHADWTVRLGAIPLPQSMQGQTSGRMIWLSGSARPELVTSGHDLRKKLRTKAQRQHLPDLPFLVAVNSLNYGIDREEAETILNGTVQAPVPTSNVGFGSSPQGVWVSRSGPQYTRLSAAMVFSKASPWMLATAPCWCFTNPWARFRLGSSAFVPLPTCVEVDGHMQWAGEGKLSTLLALTDGWPRDE